MWCVVIFDNHDKFIDGIIGPFSDITKAEACAEAETKRISSWYMSATVHDMEPPK
jgi:hypothetical protein